MKHQQGCQYVRKQHGLFMQQIVVFKKNTHISIEQVSKDKKEGWYSFLSFFASVY
jgi:hypothetical protein